MGCSFLSRPGSVGAKEPDHRTVRVAGISGTNSHYFVDQQLGLFRKHGIDVELIAFQGGTQLTQAILAGDLNFITLERTLGLASNLRGPNLFFVAGIINTFPFTITSKPEIRTTADLRGKKIAISRFGSASDTAVRSTLERYDLKPEKDVIILQIGGQSERFAALRAGVVDAAIIARLLIWSRGAWDSTISSICRRPE
jgi:NitT/TauT family transport system substrate-binding protein